MILHFQQPQKMMLGYSMTMVTRFAPSNFKLMTEGDNIQLRTIAMLNGRPVDNQIDHFFPIFQASLGVNI